MAGNADSALVDAWMERVAKNLPPEELLAAFEQAFGAMWRRAHATLGSITLTAILDRVLYTAGERFPSFSLLEMDASGLRAETFRQRAGSLHRDQVAEGTRFILLEFLTVLGSLTGDVLTPALHLELSNVTAAHAPPDEDPQP